MCIIFPFFYIFVFVSSLIITILVLNKHPSNFNPNSIYLCSELTVMVLQYTTLYTLYEFSHHTCLPFCGNGTFIHLYHILQFYVIAELHVFILLIQAISEKYSILIFFYYILIIKKNVHG